MATSHRRKTDFESASTLKTMTRGSMTTGSGYVHEPERSVAYVCVCMHSCVELNLCKYGYSAATSCFGTDLAPPSQVTLRKQRFHLKSRMHLGHPTSRSLRCDPLRNDWIPITAGHYVYVTAGNLPAFSQLDTNTPSCPATYVRYVQSDLCEKANDETGLGVHEGHPSDEAAGMSGG